MPSETTTKTSKPIALVAVVLAWLVPGAGHFYLRRRARGAIIFFTVGLTFWAGMAMGGVMNISNEGEAWWWWAADMVTGAHGLAAWQHHKGVYGKVVEEARQRLAREYSPSYGVNKDQEQQARFREILDQELARAGLALVPPMDTVSRSYSGVAGLMNLLCIFDALMLALMGRTGEPAPASPQPPSKLQPPSMSQVPSKPRPPAKPSAAEARAAPARAEEAPAGTEAAAPKEEAP